MPCFPFAFYFAICRYRTFLARLYSAFFVGDFCGTKKGGVDELKKLRSNFDLSWTGGSFGSGGTKGDNAHPNAK
jgi:hypothetical protein